MSYQVLARKWRPRSFREMVGQEHVLQALVNALDHDRLHHAYLFTGTRGVGKTTIARILAKCLNCEEGVSSEPCGKCSSCLEIAEGRSVDLLEVDAASRTKVEDTRELLENVQYAPTRARYKVYLIDEVHMLSNHSFNALLKTLEEPPPHVKFLLATTDPQKLPATILSRCLQFNLKNMPPEQIVSHLGNVLGQESVSFEEPALWLLGRSAAGSMRDALSLTDQAIAFGSGRIGEDDVRAMLGSVDLSFVYQLLEKIAEGEPREVLAVVERMAEHAPDFEGSLDELISLVHRIAIAQAVPDAIDNSWGDAERVAAIAASITAEDAQLFYQMAINGKRDIALAPDPRSGFEMILLRMLAFRPQAVIDESIDASSLQAVEVAAAPESEPGPARDMASAAGEGGAPVKKPPEVPQPAAAQAPTPLAELGQRMVESAAPERQDVAPPVTPPEPGPGPGETALGDSEPASSVAGVPDKIHDSKAVEAAQSIALAELDSANWALLLEQLGLVGIIYNTASHCELRQCKDGKLEFILDEPRAALFNEGHVDKIRLALENYFEAELSVSIAPGEIQVESPAMRCERLALERQQQAVAEIEGDPVLQGFIARFDGELDPASIAPLDQ